MKILDLPRHERPREKLLERGPTGLKDKELLAILLRTGGEGKNTIELADALPHKCPLKQPLSFGARDFMVMNHPSGGMEPSDSDREVTSRLKEAGVLLGIALLDHVIVTPESFRSGMTRV